MCALNLCLFYVYLRSNNSFQFGLVLLHRVVCSKILLGFVLSLFKPP